MKANSNHHQPRGQRRHRPRPTCAVEWGHKARSWGCMKKSRTKWENTARPAQRATGRPRRANASPNRTDQKIDAARECDQSMKSSVNPGGRPGVIVTRSMPRSTKIPNSTSTKPTPRSSSHVGARGSALSWPGRPRNDPRTSGRPAGPIQPCQDGNGDDEAEQTEDGECGAGHRTPQVNSVNKPAATIATAQIRSRLIQARRRMASPSFS